MAAELTIKWIDRRGLPKAKGPAPFPFYGATRRVFRDFSMLSCWISAGTFLNASFLPAGKLNALLTNFGVLLFWMSNYELVLTNVPLFYVSQSRAVVCIYVGAATVVYVIAVALCFVVSMDLFNLIYVLLVILGVMILQNSINIMEQKKGG
jgi:hypothetical protein